MNEDHKILMNEWVRTGKSVTGAVNKLRQTFYKKADNTLAQTMIRLQIAIVSNQLRIYVAMMVKNTTEFMIVGEKEAIEGYG